MRAIAACQFTLSRFGAWRLSVAALMACVLMALPLWFFEQPTALHWSVAAALGFVALAVVALGAWQLAVDPVSLRWDGRDWYLGPPDSMGYEPLAGSLSVAVDLGSWMLLRFRSDTAGRRPRTAWLPAQRRGLELQWHSLRCAVYSPRPARDAERNADAAADL